MGRRSRRAVAGELEPIAGGELAEDGTGGSGEGLGRGVVGPGGEAGDAYRLYIAREAEMDAGLAFEGGDPVGDEVLQEADAGGVHLVAGVAEDLVVEGVSDDEDLGIGIEAAAGEAEFAKVDEDVEGCWGEIEGAADGGEGEAAGDLDHVGGFAAKTALGEAVVEELHLGVAVIFAFGDLVAGDGENFNRFAKRIFVRGDAVEGEEVGAGVFEEEYAVGGPVGVAKPEAEGLLIVFEANGGVGALDVSVGGGDDRCGHGEEVLLGGGWVGRRHWMEGL